MLVMAAWGVELQKGWVGVSFVMTVYVQYCSGMV